MNINIPVFVLTSRKHQQDIGVQQPWDDTYQSHWRMAISDSGPGVVTILILGKGPPGEHPIHDRWWLSEKSGLPIGTSANALGIGKLSEVSLIPESDLPARLAEVDCHLNRSVREIGVERVKYLTFEL